MKKICLSLLIALCTVFAVSARNNYSRNEDQLPKAARTMISNYFKGGVSLVKTETSMGRVSEYEVILTDGTEISFDRQGNWKDVEVGDSKAVPSQIVPKNIINYVKSSHPGDKIVGIERKRNGFEVELRSGIEIRFNKTGNFIKYDD